jgi:hypothetical protein
VRSGVTQGDPAFMPASPGEHHGPHSCSQSRPELPDVPRMIAQLASSMLSSNSLQSFKRPNHHYEGPESTKSIHVLVSQNDLAAATAVFEDSDFTTTNCQRFHCEKRILVITIL